MSTNQRKEEGFKRQIKHLQQELDNLKQDSSSKNQSPINQSDDLHHRRRPTTKCRNHKCYKFYRANHANTKQLWRTVEATTGHQFVPIGNVINLGNKTYTKETFQLLDKNFSFIPTSSIFNKNLLNKELDDFFRLIKLKDYFKDNNMYHQSTEDQLFKPKTNKSGNQIKTTIA